MNDKAVIMANCSEKCAPMRTLGRKIRKELYGTLFTEGIVLCKSQEGMCKDADHAMLVPVISQHQMNSGAISFLYMTLKASIEAGHCRFSRFWFVTRVSSYKIMVSIVFDAST